MRTQGGCTGCTCTPSPQTWKKLPLRNVQKRRESSPKYVVKKNVHVPRSYDKIKTKKVGEKEDISKRKGTKIKEI